MNHDYYRLGVICALLMTSCQILNGASDMGVVESGANCTPGETLCLGLTLKTCEGGEWAAASCDDLCYQADMGRASKCGYHVDADRDMCYCSVNNSAQLPNVGAGGSGGWTANGCTVISPYGYTRGDHLESSYAPATGDVSLADYTTVELYTSTGASLAPGSFDLAAGLDQNYATCIHCVLVYEDVDEATGYSAKFYFQKSGTMNLSSVSPDGRSSGFLTDVVLEEVTIDLDSFESAPVSGGGCLHISSAAWNGQ